MQYVCQDILSRHGDDAFLSIRVTAVRVEWYFFLADAMSQYTQTEARVSSSSLPDMLLWCPCHFGDTRDSEHFVDESSKTFSQESCEQVV